MKKEFLVEGLQAKELNPKRYGGMCSRETVTIRSEKEIDFEKGIETVATTDAPAIVMDWERWEPVREILPMRYGEMPDDDEATLLDTHSRFSIHNILGSARNWMKEAKDLIAKVFVSEVETEVRQKIKEKHIKRVSIGYQTDPDYTVEIPKDRSIKIDGVEYKNEFNDGMPMLVRTWWKVKELSLVPIGADAAAKFRNELQPSIRAEDPALQQKLDEALNEINQLKQTINSKENKMDNPKELTVDEKVQQELERREGIAAIAKQVEKSYKGGEAELKQVQANAIKEDWSVDKFRAHVWEKFDWEKPINKSQSDLDLSKKEIANFDIMRMLRYLESPNDRTLREAAKFEIECSEEISKRIGVPAKGLYLPYDVQVNKNFGFSKLGKRDMTAGGTLTGAELVGTDHRPDMFIELLRNKMLTQRLGARMLRGLVGNVSIPKWTAGATAVWAATESASMTESTPTTAALTLSPHDVGGSVDVSRRLLLQSTPDAGSLIMDDLATVLAIAIDASVYHGSGASGQPTGIAGTTGIGAVTGASYEWADAVEHESDVDTANALEGTFAYVTTPAIKGLLKTREKSSGYPVFLCENNQMNGYPVFSTNQVDAGYIFFGNFAQIILAEWGNLDLYVNKIERTAISIITAITTVDVGVRQPGAFSVATGTN